MFGSKKTPLIIILLLAFGLFFVACGGNNGSTDTDESAPAVEEVTTPTASPEFEETAAPETVAVDEDSETLATGVVEVPEPIITAEEEETQEQSVSYPYYIVVTDTIPVSFTQGTELAVAIYISDTTRFEILDGDVDLEGEDAPILVDGDLRTVYFLDASIWSASDQQIWGCVSDAVKAVNVDNPEFFLECVADESTEEEADEEPAADNVGGEEVAEDGPVCHLGDGEVEVKTNFVIVEGVSVISTFDIVVAPEQGVITWSSTDVANDSINPWLTGAPTDNPSGCDYITVTVPGEHPSGINISVYINGAAVYDSGLDANDTMVDIWLGD